MASPFQTLPLHDHHARSLTRRIQSMSFASYLDLLAELPRPESPRLSNTSLNVDQNPQSR
jgi:hypothetical protein